MFIWCYVNVDSQLEQAKHVVRGVEQRLRLENLSPSLPFHISLKMSFCVSDEIAPDVIGFLTAFFSDMRPFHISVSGIEYCRNICWLRMKECRELKYIHERLNMLLSEKYGIVPHEYDYDYKFHVTLFINDDSEKVFEAYEQVKNLPFPHKLCADTFGIGFSPLGKPGTYEVLKELRVK